MERLRCLSMSFHLQVSNADVDDNDVDAGDDGDGDGDDDGVFPIIDYAGGVVMPTTVMGGVQCKCCNVQVSHRMIVILN